MISFNEAIHVINSVQVEKIEILIDITHALNHVSAEDVFAVINFPPFHQSAMDGYAVSSLPESLVYAIHDIVEAGKDAGHILIPPGGAVRIFTGAMLPKNTIAVVKQEDTVKTGNTITTTKPIRAFENIRPEGEQTKKGDLILAKGTKITPGAIGYLTMNGIFEIKVYKKPTITILATGNELVEKNKPLSSGKIYESNTYMLQAALRQYGFDAGRKIVKDSFGSTTLAARDAIENYDLVIFTGGISVGDYDYVYDVLHKMGVEELFYKVKQKPGKPVYFGKKGRKLVFALPGNPAAVLTSFYMYVLNVLFKYTDDENHNISPISFPINENYHKSKNLTYFLKGKLHNGEATILKSQSSAMLSSFVDANCLIILPEGKEEMRKGEPVEVVLIN